MTIFAAKRSITLCIFITFLFLLLSVKIFAAPQVITDDNIDTLEKTIETVKPGDFLVLQVSPQKSLNTKPLIKWVEKGGTLWFYDSRLAHHFGFKQSPIQAGELPVKTMKAEFGSNKEIPGVAIGAEAKPGNSVTIGVRKLMVFLLSVGDKQYSAVSVEKNITPLLLLPKNDGIAVSAIKSVGKGYIVFKPLLWEKHYDGATFQRRLIDFSSKER